MVWLSPDGKLRHGCWQIEVEAALQDQVLWRLLVVTALVHLIFAIWPTIDIAASQMFVLPDGSFMLDKNSFAEEIRMPIWLASVGLAVFSAGMLILSLLRGANAHTPWRLWASITALYVVGPGLLVNVLLKQNWGRARPMMVEAFGGDKIFTPPFEIARQCSRNCSFVSGEAASAAVMAIVLALLMTSKAAKPMRYAVFGLLAAMFVLAAGMRVASGRHFLSDVVFAGLFMLILARLSFQMFRAKVPASRVLGPAIVAEIVGRRLSAMVFRGVPPKGVDHGEVANLGQTVHATLERS